MVWCRRNRKGAATNRANPVENWIWSPRAVHEAFVSLEGFVDAQQIIAHRRGSRGEGGVNRHPQTKRVYRLRSYIFCELCGRRMYGKTHAKVSYYVCAPKKGYVPSGHPGASSFSRREEHLLDGINIFLAECVFGGYRRDLLASTITTSHDHADDHKKRIGKIDLAGLPDDLNRRLFEALRFEIRYNRYTSRATCRITLRGETVQPAAKIARQAMTVEPSRPDETDRQEETGWRDTGMVKISQKVASFYGVPPAGFEPAHLPPEGSALSPELRGRTSRGPPRTYGPAAGSPWQRGIPYQVRSPDRGAGSP